MLISQLGKLNRFVKRRKEIVKMYDEAFSRLTEIIIQKEIPESDTSRHLYIIRIDESKLNCGRKEFFHALAAENIQPQIHYIPVYWAPYYQALGYPMGLCSNAEAYYKNCMSIPLYPLLTDDDVSDVITAVNKVVDYYRK